ncbi:MAG: thiamine pyrophosphate-dependent dehydrogenase E1 component subunit alpha [Kiritimatiellia bacterium]
MNSKGTWLRYYRTMLVIRFFEQKVEALFAEGAVTGTAHCCIGQEASAVGVCAGLNRRDYLTSTHRGHGHFLAKGGAPGRVMAELFGKSTGYSGGRGGSQFMASPSIGFMGANGITGGSLPVANGLALSSILCGTGKVTGCFFGDGAANQGTFHECLNMASLWRLPVVYVCENNLYAMSSRVDTTTAGDVTRRAAGYNVCAESVDGNDVLAVASAVRRARKRAASGEGPSLIECRTYRYCGHSRGDPRRYRTAGEEKEWKKRDPVKVFRRRLKESGRLSAQQDAALKNEARDIVRRAVKFAKQSPYPEKDELEKGVFA